MLLRAISLSLTLLLSLSPATNAEEVVAELSQTNVSITTNFTGSEILIFGAVKRAAPAPQDSDLHVIITVAGPLEQAAGEADSLAKNSRSNPREYAGVR